MILLYSDCKMRFTTAGGDQSGLRLTAFEEGSKIKETIMHRINHYFIILITILAFWLGVIGIRAEAHEPVAAVNPQWESETVKLIATWRQKTRQYPQDDRFRVKLGDTLMQRARETGDLSNYAFAKSAFSTALDLNPKSAAAMIGMAWVYGALHQFDASIQWAEKAIAMDPKTSDAYGLLGDAAVEMGDYGAAFGHYQKMLDIRPDLSSYSRAGHLLFVTGDIHAAIELMRKAIAAGAVFAENTAWCQAEMAQMLWSTGDLPAAEQVIRTGLEQSPNNHHLLAAMGKVKAARNDSMAAIAAYEKAIAISPRQDSRVALGDLYAYTGQPGRAAAQFQQVEKIHDLHRKNGIQGDILRARFYADHDVQLPVALAEAQMAYQRYKNVFVADTLAWCYYKNGRYQNARNVIEKALRYQTPDPQIWFHAGMIYAKLGEQALASKHLKQALGLNSNFHPVYAMVAKDTLKQLVNSSSHGNDERDAET